ncbi:NOL1/NOP2/sun family protein/antitermination NusB domain-containing protein [Forsythia ovata]|uniref:NOL1/NOP2/sun family protein/antitermination NusB domain-containing protein n=1 Tax=Forsythia ovata TaxID=205694 RepID=A0ABD1S5G2_9LAMI
MEVFHYRVNTPLCNSNNYNTAFIVSMQRMISVQACNSARLLSVSSSSAAPPAKNNKKRTPRDYSAKTSTSTSRTGSSNLAGKTQKLNLEVSPHRAVSAVRLMRIELGGAFADLLNEQGKGSGDNEMGYVERTLGFRTRDLADRDLRLVTEIVGGTIRWRRYLDHLILSLCHDKSTFRGMEPLLLQILRIGFYEIVKLDMPPYAVVDENVRLAKTALRPGAGNMVNGILRKLVVIKESNSLPSPKVEGDDRQKARALATIHSHPVWMVRRWMKYLGQEKAIELMTWNNSDPYFSLRANTGKGFTRADLVTQLEMFKVPYELSAHLDDFVRIRTGMQVVIQAGLLKRGLCSVQDESAGLVVSVVDPRPGDTIVDCCAAPGGKTLFMASQLSGQGRICAIDINEGRLRILKETAELHEVDNVVTITHADLRTFAGKNCVKSDKVLLDTPCSGLGVLSKRADLRWNRRLEDMKELKHLQDELLDAASMLVKIGGVLIYSTCSIDPEENEERVVAFLQRHPEFYIDPADRYVPSNFVTEHGFYSSNPVEHSLDGAFAARLVRSR